MRYDTPILFQMVVPGEYDKKTGNYVDNQIKEVIRYASVMDTGVETMKLVYGSIQQGSLTIQLQNQYEKPFDQIRVGKKIYQVDSRRDLRTKQTFVVSEVQ